MAKGEDGAGAIWPVADDGWIEGAPEPEGRADLLPLLLRERLRGALADHLQTSAHVAHLGYEFVPRHTPPRHADADLEACSEALSDGLIALLLTPDEAATKVTSWAETLTTAWQFGVLWQGRSREIGGLVEFYGTLRREAGAVLALAEEPHERIVSSPALAGAADALLQASLRAYHRSATLDLERAASRDWLTGVFNRAYLQRRLQGELARAIRFAHPLSIVMLDIDGFKTYNDTFGHGAGDEVLQRVGQVFLATARTIDVVTRYGGDEFVIIMPETGQGGAEALTQRVQERLLATQATGDWPYPTLTLSHGVATFPDDATAEADLLRAADRRLYAMKHAR